MKLIQKFKQMGVKKSFFAILRRILFIMFSFNIEFNLNFYIKRIIYGYVIENINGFKMYLDLRNDVGISKELLIFKKREPLITELIQSEGIIKEGDTVIDIGANIGYYTLIESRLVGPSGTVYALEPVSSNFVILNRNIELNGIKNVKTFKLAAGNENKEDEIYVASKGNISSFILNKEAVYVRKEKVKIITIDNFVLQQQIQPNFIRMDVEGYESEIIRGMIKTMKSSKPILLIEVHPHLMKKDKLKEMFYFIKESGYTKVIVVKERNIIWMKRNGEVNSLLLYLTRKIEGKSAVGMGNIEYIRLEELYSNLEARNSAFHVLIS